MQLQLAQAKDGGVHSESPFETLAEAIQAVRPDRIYVSSCADRELLSHMHRLEHRGKASQAMDALLTSVYDLDSASVHGAAEAEGVTSDWVHLLLSSSFRYDQVRCSCCTVIAMD